MGTVSDVLRIARGEIGYSMKADPQRGSKYGRWMAQYTGEAWYGGDDIAYCACFTSWVLNQAKVPCAGLPGAYCPTAYAKAKKLGSVISKANGQPGDVIYFDWQGDGVTDHVGIIEVNHGTYYQTIEGNTDGGRVLRRTRAMGTVFGIVRPNYTEENPQKPGQPINWAGMAYRVHAQTYGWLDPVHDGQVAGTVGYGLRAEALKLTPPEGVILDVTAHLQDIGDVVYRGIQRGQSSGTGSSKTDPLIGSTGEARRLEGIAIKCVRNETGKELAYRVHLQDIGWTAWKHEGEFAGTRGQSRRLEAIQIKFV